MRGAVVRGIRRSRRVAARASGHRWPGTVGTRVSHAEWWFGAGGRGTRGRPWSCAVRCRHGRQRVSDRHDGALRGRYRLTRPVPPRHDRETDRDRPRYHARRRVVERIAEAKTAAASVAAFGTTFRRTRIGRGGAFVRDGRIARLVGHAVGGMIEGHDSRFREEHARIERHCIRSVK
ncbi:hypothetical protein BCEP27_20308 [Burkholderia cepacia]